MNFKTKLVEAKFIERLNRFTASVDLGGSDVLVHIPNSGRMHELLIKDYPILIEPACIPSRKTAHTLIMVQIDSSLCVVDSRFPPYLIEEAIKSNRIKHFQSFTKITREVALGNSRINLMLESGDQVCYIETKSVTLIRNKISLFPDAPTKRGVKHLGELANAIKLGQRAALIFVIQRQDTVAFMPNCEADPEFCIALRSSLNRGVEAYAYRCSIDKTSISINEQIPVDTQTLCQHKHVEQ